MKTDKIKVILVVGARPNFIKVAPILEEMQGHKAFEPILLHTGQHYDTNMSDSFFRDLEMPRPDIFLGVGSGSHAEQTAKVMVEFEKVLLKEMPHFVVVVGDVNSTLACALATSKIDYGEARKKKGKGEKGNSGIWQPTSNFCGRRPLIAHVEAGLRSFDRSMPEEINRMLTDQISDFLFVSEPSGIKNLKKEGIPDDKIFFVGNVMIDTLLKYKIKAEGLGVAHRVQEADTPYAVLTLHRPSNVDDRETFSAIAEGLQEISKDIPIIFPIHPRTRKQIEAFGLDSFFVGLTDNELSIPNNGIHLTNPLGFLEFLNLNMNARFVLTDSGGIQEETTVLGIPCLTLRDNTERPITITKGTNRLVNARNLVSEIRAILDSYKPNSVNSTYSALSSKPGEVPELWDGKAAERIVEILVENYKV